MKKIIINGKFLSQNITGVQRYAREITLELDKIIGEDIVEIAIPLNSIDIPEYNNIKVVQVKGLKNQLWEQITFARYVLKKKGISLNLCNSSPLLIPGIVCIHDMKPKATPQYFGWKFLLWYKVLWYNSMKRAKCIITVSEFSKTEISKFYNVDKSKVYVIPNSCQHYERIGYDENVWNKYTIDRKNYFFALSSLEPNKNFKWIAEIAKNNPEFNFIVGGSINKKIFASNVGYECPDNMRLIGRVSDEEAKALMRECKAFLFPSFYEGFGIPPLEAINAGAKKIIVSDIPVMHEVFDENAIYINPCDYTVDMKMVLVNAPTVDGAVVYKYSWEESAIRLRSVLMELSL